MIRARERIDDKEWLDLHLSPSRWSRRMSPDEVVQNYLRVLQEASVQARAKAPAKLLNVEYAPGLAIDFLAASEAQLVPGAATPIVVYVHGGYWQFMSKDESSFLATEIVAAGYTHAAVDYTLCPGVTLAEQVEQVRSAVRFIHSRFPTAPLHLIGHSAGAHLCAMVLLGDLSESLAQQLQHACLVSGVFDVWPAASAPSVNIDNLLGVSNETTARELSPQWLLDQRAVSIPAHWRVSVVYGEFDPPEFCAQSEDFRAALTARGVREHFGGVVAGKDHFDVMEDMRYADDATGRAFRAVIR